LISPLFFKKYLYFLRRFIFHLETMEREDWRIISKNY